MASVGEILRRERERQGLSLALVAEQTRIRLQFLEALEKDDYSKIPGRFFVRSFTTQYAQKSGGNPNELHAALQRQTGRSDPKLGPVTDPLRLSQPDSRVSVDPLPEGTASAVSARTLTVSVIALAAVVVACGSIFWLWQ